MINFFVCLIISVLTSYGMAIIIVEKGKDFPIRKYRIRLQKIIHDYIGRKWSRVILCAPCCSVWCCLFSDIIIGIIALCHGSFYFFFPFSGFICAGIVWYSIEHLNAIDKESNINVFIDKKDVDE